MFPGPALLPPCLGSYFQKWQSFLLGKPFFRFSLLFFPLVKTCGYPPRLRTKRSFFCLALTVLSLAPWVPGASCCGRFTKKRMIVRLSFVPFFYWFRFPPDTTSGSFLRVFPLRRSGANAILFSSSRPNWLPFLLFRYPLLCLTIPPLGGYIAQTFFSSDSCGFPRCSFSFPRR